MFWTTVGAIVVVLLVVGYISAAATERKKKEYLGSLEALKADPSNANLRQKTLELGRIYSEATRDNKGRTMFDEVALMNDIGAACAGSAHIAPSSSQMLQAATSVEERLRKLKTMHNDGLINDDDFTRKKRELMNEL